MAEKPFAASGLGRGHEQDVVEHVGHAGLEEQRHLGDQEGWSRPARLLLPRPGVDLPLDLRVQQALEPDELAGVAEDHLRQRRAIDLLVLEDAVAEVTLDAIDDGLLLEQVVDELVGRHDRRAELGEERRGGRLARTDTTGHAEARDAMWLHCSTIRRGGGGPLQRPAASARVRPLLGLGGRLVGRLVGAGRGVVGLAGLVGGALIGARREHLVA